MLDHFSNICSNDSDKKNSDCYLHKKTRSTKQGTFKKQRLKVDESLMVNLGSDAIVLNIEEELVQVKYIVIKNVILTVEI